VSESPETTPLSAKSRLRRFLTDDVVTTDEKRRALLRDLATLDAARATVPTGPDDIDLRVRRIVERAANMGGCSQTGHEHLSADARKVEAAMEAARPVPAAEPRCANCGAEAHPETPHVFDVPYVDDAAVPAADDRERLALLLYAIATEAYGQRRWAQAPWPTDMYDWVARRLLDAGYRAGVSPSTGDADRLHEAIRAVYYEDKHPDLSGGLTTDPADARLAAAILRRLG
jgi:hypothetical protein